MVGKKKALVGNRKMTHSCSSSSTGKNLSGERRKKAARSLGGNWKKREKICQTVDERIEDS